MQAGWILRTCYALIYFHGIIGSFDYRKTTKCEKPCYSGGTCRNGTCVCLPGWTGAQCESCFGRVRLTAPTGYITDGFGNYSTDLRCSWFIDGGSTKKPVSKIRLRLDSFSTECGWDHVFLFDSDGVYGEQFGALSGLYNDNFGTRLPEITINSSQAFLYFYSDNAFNSSGFNISYSMDGCPMDCSGHGDCNRTTGICSCNAGFAGADCSQPACVDLSSCQQHGKCETTTNQCTCAAGYRGPQCNISVGEAVWEIVHPTEAVYVARAAHAASVIDDDMWVIGGASFSNGLFPNVLKYNFHKNAWTVVDSSPVVDMHAPINDSYVPSVRYDHSLVAKGGFLYMFGGVMNKRFITAELWEFSTVSASWTVRNRDSPDLNRLPYAVSGHTAHIVGNKMLVFFGLSSDRGYLNEVQELDLTTFTWTLVKTQGAVVTGTFGHTSVYDWKSDKVFVFGGFVPRGSTLGTPTDAFHSYDVTTQTWTQLPTIGFSRFKHAAALLAGSMVVFGGNGHNESSNAKPTECYSDSVLVFDAVCTAWYQLPFPTYLPYGIERFGHSAVTYNGSAYFYGGFDGLMLGDVIRFSPGECSALQTKEACWAAQQGAKCGWAQSRCVRIDSESRSDSKDDKYQLKLDEPSTSCASVILSDKKCMDFSGGDCVTCQNLWLGCTWCDNGCASYCDRPAQNCSTSRSDVCRRQMTCHGCQSQPDCKWLTPLKLGSDVTPCVSSLDTVAGIEKQKLLDENQVENEKNAKPSASANENDVGVAVMSSAIPLVSPATVADENNSCPESCASFNSCDTCISGQCMWCANLQRCTDINAYNPSYMYGQCLYWVTSTTGCVGQINCTMLLTCDDCHNAGLACGWCDDGSNTGRGQCMSGNVKGPVKDPVPSTTAEPTSLALLDSDAGDRCPADRWYFFGCPACQCNGHGHCLNETTLEPGQLLTCEQCEDMTAGPHCETCSMGHYGNALNGGNCSLCECNGHASDCDRSTGTCYCFTKGVKGPHCDRCEDNEPKKYMGDPRNNGTCYYELSIDFVFTFTLKKEDDENITRINFISTPPKENTDVTFKIECDGFARLNLSFIPPFGAPRYFLRGMRCQKIERRFGHEELQYGSNGSFHVQVFDFRVPIVLQISFAQSPDIDWVKFFITFASCFLSLLIVAAILWKVKLRIDIYRRRQRMFVEMAQMASRPFGCAHLELPPHGAGLGVKQAAGPVSIEPCSDYKAAVLTIAVRLPTGGKKYAPSGQSGLAVASALVAITPSHLAQLQTPPSPQPEQKVKRRRPTCLS